LSDELFTYRVRPFKPVSALAVLAARGNESMTGRRAAINGVRSQCPEHGRPSIQLPAGFGSSSSYSSRPVYIQLVFVKSLVVTVGLPSRSRLMVRVAVTGLVRPAWRCREAWAAQCSYCEAWAAQCSPGAYRHWRSFGDLEPRTGPSSPCPEITTITPNRTQTTHSSQAECLPRPASKTPAWRLVLQPRPVIFGRSRS
jgi:hypothetical protein